MKLAIAPMAYSWRQAACPTIHNHQAEHFTPPTRKTTLEAVFLHNHNPVLAGDRLVLQPVGLVVSAGALLVVFGVV